MHYARKEGVVLNLAQQLDDSAKDIHSKNIVDLSKKIPKFRKSKMTPDLVDSAIYDDDRMDDIYHGITQNIFIEMKKQNLSISDLARLSTIDAAHVSRIVNGKTRIGLPGLIKISIALHVSISELLPFDNNRRRTNGQRFDEMTKEMDLASKNFLLGICADYVKEWRRISK